MRRLASVALAALALLAVTGRAAEAPGGRIIYSRADGGRFQLHVMNADGTGDRVLPGQTDHFNYFPVWSPDGRRLAYTSMGPQGENQHVNLCSADGTGLVALTGPGDSGWLAAWSPDGRQLLFAGRTVPRGPVVDAYLASADGTGVRSLNPGRVAGGGAFWLPDGKRVGFARFQDGKARLILAKVEGGDEEPLVEDSLALWAGGNAVSPDGKRLAFAVLDVRGKKGTLHTFDFANKVDTAVAEFEAPSRYFAAIPCPAWSPDGRSLLVPMGTEKGTGLFLVSEDGKQKRRLTPEGADCFAGAWTGTP
jgi:Tol biopolymer transport system component